MATGKYLDSLMTVLAAQKETSLREFSHTDLNSNEQINEINVWHKTVVNLINNDPPKYHVRCLVIDEDEQGRVVRVNYDYYGNYEVIKPPSIIVKTNLYE